MSAEMQVHRSVTASSTTCDDARIAEWERLAAEATPGPWEWFGNTKTYQMYLATVERGRIFVMNFVRWGMGDAQPRFQHRDGFMVKADSLVQYEATYRKDFRGIDHPDARFIAGAREAVPALIAEVRRLRALVAQPTPYDGKETRP